MRTHKKTTINTNYITKTIKNHIIKNPYTNITKKHQNPSKPHQIESKRNNLYHGFFIKIESLSTRTYYSRIYQEHTRRL